MRKSWLQKMSLFWRPTASLKSRLVLVCSCLFVAYAAADLVLLSGSFELVRLIEYPHITQAVSVPQISDCPTKRGCSIDETETRQ
jgi:hypothetical protein